MNEHRYDLPLRREDGSSSIPRSRLARQRSGIADHRVFTRGIHRADAVLAESAQDEDERQLALRQGGREACGEIDRTEPRVGERDLLQDASGLPLDRFQPRWWPMRVEETPE